MTVKLADVQRDPCACTDCVIAGVSDRPQRRDPHTGRWLHGRDLRRWYEAREQFRAQWAARLR